MPREMTDKDGNLLWFGNYTGWGRLKEETKVTDSAYQPFRLQTSTPTVRRGCVTTSSGITSLMREVCESGSDWVAGWR
ncbi:MAG: RHS domain-containing protein [Veillonella sp.]